jgi:hypothetical protein
MVVAAQALTGKWDDLGRRCEHALWFTLQVQPGIYVRWTKGDPRDVSADQLISPLAAWTALESADQIRALFLATLRRFGFAQNRVDGLSGDRTTKKIPDFMALRAAPLFARSKWWLYPVANFADLYLIVLVLGDGVYRLVGKDPVDINNTLMTLATCRAKRPTPVSVFAAWLWPKVRPEIQKDLERYHRAEAGGNPEIASYWKPIVERWF